MRRFVEIARKYEMEEMEIAICEAIAENSPFCTNEVYRAWKNFDSFDLIVKAVNIAAVQGHSSILTTILYLRKMSGGLTPRALDICPECGSYAYHNPDCSQSLLAQRKRR